MNDCAVVGAGIHGLCASFWLRQAGARVVVLERFGPEHAHGSSHGALRITTAQAPRIVGISACSGHGFKFGPVVGRQAADAALASLPGPRR